MKEKEDMWEEGIGGREINAYALEILKTNWAKINCLLETCHVFFSILLSRSVMWR